MNDYFCTVGDNIVKTVPTATKTYVDYLPPPLLNSIYCEPVTDFELLKIIESMNVNKSSGPDDISPRIIKENIADFVPPLKYIFNLSLEQSIVPDKLKIAKVIPIFKKGDIHEPSNYRPISLLSIINKLLEKVVYKRLNSFFDKHHILYDHQFGFRKNHSTVLTVLETIDMCYKKLD